MREAYDYVYNLIIKGQFDYRSIDKGNKEELVAILYKEASPIEREEWLNNSDFSHNIYESISCCLNPTLDSDDTDRLEDLNKNVLSILIEMCSFKADKLFDLVADEMESNEELNHQDHLYTSELENLL